MTNTQLFLEGLEVDLTDVINIPLNKTFEDLADPTAINNEFSKTIKLPVSVKNNEVLGNAFRLDRVIIEANKQKNIGEFLNPTNKIPFNLLHNGDLIMEGYAKLSLVDYSVNDKFYTLNLFGTLGDLFHKLLNVAVTLKFCPAMDITDIWEDTSTQTLHDYAIPFDKKTNKIAEIETAIQNPELFIWRDNRYLMDDYLSGERTISAKYIKECWKTEPTNNVEKSSLDEIKKDKRDFDIVGFMPTHHGFPNNFDPTAYEYRDSALNYCLSGQFVDTADANSKNISGREINTSQLIGNGLTEEQFQQFVSWQQKPYIYINKLFMLFQKEMEKHPDLFDDYKLEIDENWALVNPDSGEYYNPYWYKLCYTLDFLFNEDIEVSVESRDISTDNSVQYTHYVHSDGYTEQIGLKSPLDLHYSDKKVISTVTLDGYACIAWPALYNVGGVGHWHAEGYSRLNGTAAYGVRESDLEPFMTRNPQLFFTHYHKHDKNKETGDYHIVNGGYKVIVRVLDEDNNIINTITNVWRPKYLAEIEGYKDCQTTLLTNGINGEDLDIIREANKDKAAVLLHKMFRGSEITNNKLYSSYSGIPNYYIGIGFPLRSFGSIPVGIKKPKFEVEIQAISEYFSKIASGLNFCIGCYSAPGQKNDDSAITPCNINNTNLFPYTNYGEWVNQGNSANWTTMFYQEMNNSRNIVVYKNYSNTPGISTWLNAESSGSEYWRHGGATWMNNYGRYYSLVRQEDIDNPDIMESDTLDSIIKIGQEQAFKTTTQFVEDNHKSKILLENIWKKETGLFNVLIEYSKIFGLYWNVDIVNKKIQLLTRLSYFKDYTVEDWSNKVDYSKDLQITPILHASKYLNFDYEKENDAYHYTDYGENYLTRYGGYKLKTGYEFTPDSEDLFKGIHTTCISNRNILTWNSIYNFNPKYIPFVINSPFQMMDADSKDGTKPIVINNWIFRNSNIKPFTDDEKDSGKWYTESAFQIIDDSPLMTATQKYAYISATRSGDDFYTKAIGCVENCDTFPNFSIVTGDYGCLFTPPAEGEDYTIGDIKPDGNRDLETKIFKTRDGRWIYEYAWRKWMEERYNINNKKLTCYVNLKPNDFYDITPLEKRDKYIPYFANFKVIDGQLYILNRIFDYNIQSNEPTKCEFIQISDIDAYADWSLIDFVNFEMSDNTSESTGYKPVLENNVYNLPMIDITIPDCYHDYHSYMLDAEGSKNTIRIFHKPALDVDTWFLNSEYGSFADSDVVKHIPYSQFEDNFNVYEDNVAFKPYFTWFINANEADKRSVDIVAQNSNNERRSVTYGLSNIQPFIHSNTEYEGDLVQIPNQGTWSSAINIKSNTGLIPRVVAYHSFYEIPLLCTKHTEIGEGKGYDEIVVYNVIIPTENRCVGVTSGQQHYQRFDNSTPFSIYNEEMKDGMYNQAYRDIVKDLKDIYGYDNVEILPNAEGNKKPYNLFTTVVWALDGCENSEFRNTNSFKYASNCGANSGNIPHLYAGFDDSRYTTDFDLQKESKYSLWNVALFGCGRYICKYNSEYVKLYSDYSNDQEVTDWKEVIDNKWGYRLQSAIPAEYFFNNPNTDITQRPYPLIGQCRIEDYYKYGRGNLPFLIDFDYNSETGIDGEDGYVYQTFYQPVFEEESYLTLKHDGGKDFPTYIDPCGETKFGIESTLVNIHTYYEDVNISVSVRPYDDTVITSNINEGVIYDSEQQGLTIFANNTGYSRIITITATYPNSIETKSVEIYQAVCG